MVLPDTEKRVMRRINLCSRHTPPDHILGTITSFQDISYVLCTMGSAGGAGWHHGRGLQTWTGGSKRVASIVNF
jgi:hypothetical protein